MSLTESVLLSTKKVLGIPGNQDAFDQDVLTYINSAFSVLSQLGVLDEAGLEVDESLTWDDLAELGIPTSQIQYIRTYVFLKCQMLFDPPTTSFLIAAREKQLEEHEWRLSTMREYSIREEEVDAPADVDA